MKRKLILISIPIGLILIVAGVLAARWRWYYAYSRGSRTGVLRKLSVKGSPVCRYYSGELVTIGSQPGLQPDVWEFSVDDYKAENPLVLKLHAAEKEGRRVTLEYRHDLGNKGKLWPCSPTDYYVVGVE